MFLHLSVILSKVVGGGLQEDPPRTETVRTDIPWGPSKRAVRILLECILVDIWFWRVADVIGLFQH